MVISTTSTFSAVDASHGLLHPGHCTMSFKFFCATSRHFACYNCY